MNDKTNGQRYSGFKILIVDDNENNLFTLQSLISTHTDVQVVQAGSGQQALDIALSDSDIDLIILDVQMPEMDGFQTASMLGIRKKTRDIPVIFLTAAFKSDDFRQKGYELGAVDYLLKPIDDDLLLNKLTSYFRLIEKERQLNQLLEQKVAERTIELERISRYLERLIDTMGEALLVLAPDSCIKQVNPAARELLGYAGDTLLGRNIGEVFEEADADQAGAFMGTWLEAVIRTGVVKDVEAIFISSQGQRIPVLFSRTALMDEQNEVTDIICIAKNMTGYTKAD